MSAKHEMKANAFDHGIQTHILTSNQQIQEPKIVKKNEKTSELHTGSLFTPITPIKNLGGNTGTASNQIHISTFNNQKRQTTQQEFDDKHKKENQESRHKDAPEIILSEQYAGRSSSSTKNNTSNNPEKSKNQHHLSMQTS